MKKVLVVDNDEQIREVLELLLTTHGYQPIIADADGILEKPFELKDLLKVLEMPVKLVKQK